MSLALLLKWPMKSFVQNERVKKRVVGSLIVDGRDLLFVVGVEKKNKQEKWNCRVILNLSRGY